MPASIRDLVSAVANDDYDGAARLIADGLSAATLTAEGEPLLLFAQGARMIAWLKARGARWPDRLRNGETPFHAAVVFAADAAIDDLLASGASFLETDYLGRSVLERACESRPAVAVRMLEQPGAVEALPFALASRLLPDILRNAPAAIVHRLATPAFVAALSDAQRDALLAWAVARGDTHIARGVPGALVPAAALIAAATQRNEAGLSRLLAAGAAVDGRDPRGETALHAAARAVAPGCIEILLAAGASPQARDHGGRTALHALSNGNAPVSVADTARAVAALIGSGADPAAVDDAGESVVTSARREGRFDVALAIWTQTGNPALSPWTDATAEGIVEGVLARGTLSVHWRPHHPSHPLLLLCNQRYDEWWRPCTVADALGTERAHFAAAGTSWLIDFLSRREPGAPQPSWAQIAAAYGAANGSAPTVLRPRSGA